MTVTPAQVEPLEFAKLSRETHVKWAEYLRAYPAYPTEDVGNVEHHEWCIKNYDAVIERLAQVPVATNVRLT